MYCKHWHCYALARVALGGGHARPHGELSSFELAHMCLGTTRAADSSKQAHENACVVLDNLSA